MSRSALIGLNWRPKKMCEVAVYGNAWGTAPVVWKACWEAWVSRRSNWMSQENLKILYAIANSDEPGIPEHHVSMLRFCSDRAVVFARDYLRFGADVRKWLFDFPLETGVANHWGAVATVFEAVPPFDAIGLHATSVTDNPFADELYLELVSAEVCRSIYHDEIPEAQS